MTCEGQRILITGAAGGIGQALARRLYARGARLALSGRSEDSLLDVAATLSPQDRSRTCWVVADLNRPSEWPILIENVLTSLGGLDVMIHNAAVAHIGQAVDISPTEIEEHLRVNLWAPMELSRLALPSLIESQGTLVHILSGAALISVPSLAAYSASKAGLAAWGEALQLELAPCGVNVLNVYAGPTDTPMLRRSPLAPNMAAAESAEELAEAVIEAIESRAKSLIRGSTERRQKMKALLDARGIR